VSTPQAIAAVTAILFDEVTASLPGLPGVVDLVTVGHPQVAREGRTDPQLNLFLYQITPDATWRNQDVPGKPGTTFPLLALRLSYLVTAFGQDDDDRQAHDLLGAVMHRFHTKPVIPRRAADPLVSASELAQQFEPVRLTLQPLTLDDLSKVWAGSATPYRLSVGYEASVVLIDSGQPARSTPPVLGRASGTDKGFGANTMAGEPTAESLRFPDGLSGVRTAPADLAGQKWVPDKLTLIGLNLDHADLRLVFRHLRLGFGYIATPAAPAEKPTQLGFRLAELVAFRELPGQALDAVEVVANQVVATDPTAWPAGVYTVAAARAVRVKRDVKQLDGSVVTQEVFDRLYTTAPLAFGVLPRPDTAAPFELAFSGPAGSPPTDAAMTVKLVEPIRLADGQQVRLFAGGLELPGRVTSGDGLTLNWQAADPPRLQGDIRTAAARGEILFLRVQVDAVDSSLLKPPAAGASAPPRMFDPALIVTVS
jgi:hypothetical protein